MVLRFGSIPNVFTFPGFPGICSLTYWKELNFLNLYHQQKKVNKSVWRMPWLSEAMKDVTGCDKFRLGAYNRLTRKFPNGETHLDEDQVSCEQSWEANPEN